MNKSRHGTYKASLSVVYNLHDSVIFTEKKNGTLLSGQPSSLTNFCIWSWGGWNRKLVTHIHAV